MKLNVLEKVKHYREKGDYATYKNLILSFKEAIKLYQDLVEDKKVVHIVNSPFKVGEEVLCQWGTNDFSRRGIVVDPDVKYNFYMKFSEENCEPACILRFEDKGCIESEYNCVVPWRCIKKD